MTISTKIGFGQKVSGQIMVTDHLDSCCLGKIVVSLFPVGREFLEKAGLVGVAAVVLPSIHWRDFEYLQKANEFPLLILLKFGKLDLSEELAGNLGKLDGKNGILDGDGKTLTV